MSCPYCYENFDLISRNPILLSCSHTYCQQCVLLLSEIMRYCPLDNKIVNFERISPNPELIDQLKFLCENHNETIIGICENCTEFFCSICIKEHKSCKTFSGTLAKIKSHLSETIELAMTKSFQVSETLQDQKLINFDDGIVWIEEHLKELKNALKEIEFAKNNHFCNESVLKIIEKYKNLKKIETSPESASGNQLVNSEALAIPEKSQDLDLNFGMNFDMDSLGLKSSEILQNLLKNFNKLDETISEILKKLKLNKNPFLIFFFHKTINADEFGQYFCYFSHSHKGNFWLQGFAFGRPSKRNSSIYVSCFEVTLNEKVLIKEELLIPYDSEDIVYEHLIKKPFLLEVGVEIFIHVEVEGSGNYLFSGQGFNFVTTKGVDQEVFSENFPILYFI